MGKEYSNPSSKVYKILWAERCGADWPCKEVSLYSVLASVRRCVCRLSAR